MKESMICLIKAGAVCNQCFECLDVVIILIEAIQRIQCQNYRDESIEFRQLQLDLFIQVILQQSKNEEVKEKIKLIGFLLWKQLNSFK